MGCSWLYHLVFTIIQLLLQLRVEISTGTTLGSQGNVRMLFENAGGGTAESINVNITANYILTTSADNQDIHHQLNSNNNSTNSSLQSDANGRSIHYWQRIG